MLEQDPTAQASEWTQTEPSSTQTLRQARDSFTGTVSDRQELAHTDDFLYDENQASESVELVEDAYPGRTFRLHFDAGEQAKYLVVTPLYAEAADGDCQLMLMLKDPDGDQQIPEAYQFSSVIIQDEDEPEPVVVSMAETTVSAKDGKASITVTRSGRINDIVGVHLASWGGSAVMGEDYSGIGADLYFPMGITSRTVEIPVGHGATTKDFYVTLSAVTETELQDTTAHVLIPAVGQEVNLKAASLRGTSNDIKLGDKINLKEHRGYKIGTYFKWLDDGYGFQSETPDDEENSWAGWQWTLTPGYFYDGFVAQYDYYLNWCDGQVDFNTLSDESGMRTYSFKDDDGGNHAGNTLYWYFGETKTPYAARANIKNYNNDGWAWTDDYATLTVKSVEPIIRRFEITVADPVMADGSKPTFAGVNDATAKQYVSVLLNDSEVDHCTIWGGENFSISQPMGQRYTRLVAIDAVKSDGSTYRLVSGNGTSQTLVAVLTESIVNELGSRGFFEWVKGPGGPTKDKSSKQGELTVRPVFEYIDAEVSIQENQYGELYTTTPVAPTVLWDFNKDQNMNSCMGRYSRHEITWKGERDTQGNDYYTFINSGAGSDPYVSIDLRADSVESVSWVKVRAKNLSSATAIELYGHTGGRNLTGASCVHVDLASDSEWHTYLIYLPDENIRTANAYKGVHLTETDWRGTVDWMRLDPMWNEGNTLKQDEQIQIDYVAFFSSKEAAELFREGTGGETKLAPGTYRFHMGDVLQLSTRLTNTGVLAGLTGDGFRYNLYSERNGETIDPGIKPYTNGVGMLKLRGCSEDETKTGRYYRIEPTFTHTENQLIVQIEQENLAYFKTTEGLFATEDKWLDGTTWNYRVAAQVRSNEIFELWAETVDPTHVPIWTSAQDTGTYSGRAFYLMTGVFPADNVVKLSVNTRADSHALYALSGSTYAQVMNLTTGMATDELVPAKDAMITAGMVSAVSDETGDFSLPAMYLVGNTTVRYTVTYNGSVSIREAKLAPAGAKKSNAIYYNPETGAQETVEAVAVSLNTVAVDSYSVLGAHFEQVDIEQDGILGGMLSALSMNGQTVKLQVHVDPGQEYVYHNQAFTEHVTDVTFYFQNQTTKEIHGTYSIHDKPDPLIKGKVEWDPETLTATLTYQQFSPDAPGEYDAGDVLMLQLSTDKKVGVNAFAGKDMVYDPVSTGIAVITDLNYEPQSFDYEIPNVANLLQIMGPDEGGTGQGSDYSFGRFPFMGEVNVALQVLTVLVNRGSNKDAQRVMNALRVEADAEAADYPYYDEEEGYDGPSQYVPEEDGLSGEEGEGAPKPKSCLSVAFSTEKTFYGGIRFMIAVVGTKNSGSAFKNLTNPYKDADQAWEFFTSGQYNSGAQGDLIYNTAFDSKGEEIQSMFGGSRFTIGVYVGLYLDFGYVVKDGAKSGSMVFMGAGGFFGGQVTIGYTFYSTFFGIPIYLSPEASLDVKFFIGTTASPDMTLEKFQKTGSIIGDDFGLNFELEGRLQAGLSIGVGIYKVLGARVSGFVGFNAGYGLGMDEWYPAIDSSWGYTTDFTASGTLDLVITSIDLYSLSFPLPWNAGWMACFQEVNRAKSVRTFVKNGIARGDGSDEARRICQQKVDELSAILDDREHLTTELVSTKGNELRHYAYDNGVITWLEFCRAWMNRQGGIIGGIIEEDLFDEGIIGGNSSSVTKHPARAAERTGDVGLSLRTRAHVNSQWVAQNTPRRSAFRPVHTETLQRNAYTQTASRIMAIGNNQYLMVFLGDNADRDLQMAGQLFYTIYDANTDVWTTPKAIQNDATVDGKPSLTDAGDKIILTWSSIPDAKYAELKKTVAGELTPLNQGKAPSEDDVLSALEADPVRVMALMEVYAVSFDKAAKRFDQIEQLTDDPYYDDNPQAVYDAETGDYIVLYYKTAQDDESYANATDQLLDLAGIGADPDKTYAMLGYMLYNNQTEAKDTNGVTHEPGWARDYLFPNETSQTAEEQAEFLADWGGQRFLSTAVAGMSDPPIGDLTVCAGYNGLAAYAFTVDKDYDLSTGADKDLYLQFYRFSNHSTYVPVKVAGDQKDNGVVSAVEVGAPKLVRNDGSTWLFWREDGESLKYLNVSELLNAKVAASAEPGEDDWTWAVLPNGKLAVDAVTGETYEPKVQTVDFGSLTNDGKFNGVEYDVITDGDDNLYVVWADTLFFKQSDSLTGEEFRQTAQEIYASAMIKHDPEDLGTAIDTETGAEVASTGVSRSANWSKPYRLTSNNCFNDGLALALDENGGLIIVHNQYQKLLANSREKVQELLEQGKLGIKERDGVRYVVGSFWYDSPVDLTVTRCAAVGSAEITNMSFSHSHPLGGEVVKVYAMLENVGLTAAEGCRIDFYECKDGVPGKRIIGFDSLESLQVNTLRSLSFYWPIPDDGAEAYTIQAVVSEKKSDGTYYPPVVTNSEPFRSEAAFSVSLDSMKQNGDTFEAVYSVTNIGNVPAPEGTLADLYMIGLYGDLKDRYGIDEDLLVSEDLTGLAPRETRVIRRNVTLPISVFEYCGYDAVQASVHQSGGEVYCESDQRLMALDAPINLTLNQGSDLSLKLDESRKVSVDWQTTAFVEVGAISYAVDDTSVASVDAEGNVTALGVGETELTATLMPSGRSVSIRVKVTPAWKPSGKNPFVDVPDDAYYAAPALWAVANEITFGVDATHFAPNRTATRAEVVTFLWRAAGCPEPASSDNPFTDVPNDQYFTKPVLWAVEKGITVGTSETTFSPNDTCTRAQFVTFLHRFAGNPAAKSAANPFKDVSEKMYYYGPVLWAVERKVTMGTSETEFSPDDKVTRAQVVTFLYRYLAD